MQTTKGSAISSVLVLAAISGAAHAACYELRKIDGVLTDVPVACAALDRPVPCSRETLLPNGSRLIEDRQCESHEKMTVQGVERSEEIATKKQCGKDFRAIRIGMQLERFEQCTDGAAFVATTRVKDASIETYRSTFYLIQVRGGRIVAFTRK